jgi:hypothetical protein
LEQKGTQIGWHSDLGEVSLDLRATLFALHLDLVLDDGIPGVADVGYSLLVKGVNVVNEYVDVERTSQRSGLNLLNRRLFENLELDKLHVFLEIYS